MSFETSCQTTCLKEREKFHVIYYLIFVKNKSEFLPVLCPKFEYKCIRKTFLKISFERKLILPHKKNVVPKSDFNLLVSIPNKDPGL